MTQTKRSRGRCAYCGRDFTRGGMTRHLNACPERAAAIAAAGRRSGTPEPWFHLLVRDRWSSDFWLHLEMAGSAPLKELDRYLRAIWLECCGHLSQFSFGGWSGQEIPMRTRASQVFEPGITLTHIYDFGTSSETEIEVVGEREGRATTPHPIALMSRNEPPEAPCQACSRPASWLCMECVYEYDKAGFLCEQHAKKHPHEDYGELIPLVNSPRVGMCGYDGPAEAPY